MTARAVTLVHDYLLTMRGAERAFATITECYPDAPISTLLWDPAGTEHLFDGRAITTSHLQRLRVRQASFRRLFPLFPRAAERLPLGNPDLVISSSSAFAHGVRAPDGAPHVCYCYTPFRYAWHDRDSALAEVPTPMSGALAWMLDRFRAWDRSASTRTSHYIAISEAGRARIADCWGREASVVYPPVQTSRFGPGTPDEFFMVVGQMVRHKRIDDALEAARRAGARVVVVGDGPERGRLERIYAGSAKFTGRISDDELADLYRRARAVIVPSVEEFGIVAVEAQASGRPVIAADAGGARETIIDGETGIRIPPGDVAAFAEAIRYTDFDRFDPARATANADRFSAERFRAEFPAEVARLVGDLAPPVHHAPAYCEPVREH